MPPKIGFYLMGRKGFYTLETYVLRLQGASIAYVIGARDNALARDYYDDIQDLCTRAGVPFYDRKEAGDVAVDYRFALGWRWLIPNTERLIILHDSLLPRYRGFAPLVNALINGEKQIGVTALFAGASYDTGPIVGQRSLDVHYPLRIATAIEALAPLYAELVISIATKILKGETIEATDQEEAEASYSLWRNEDDYRIDWSLSAASIRRSIDALGFPYRGANAWADDEKCRILEAEEVDDVRIENRDAGKVIFLKGDFPVVVCGTGLILLKKVVYDASGEDMLPLKRFRTHFN